MQYTRNGKRISAEEFNRLKSGDMMPGGGKPGGFLGSMVEGAKNMLGSMFKPSETKTIFRDGNKITYEQATPEQKRYIDEHNAGRAKLNAKYKHLGEVKESSGQNFAGGTADRQLIKAQPGEYMLPVDTVNKLGGPAKLDQLVAKTDSNSTPAKLGMRSKETPQVGPPMPMQPQINLIPAPTGGKKGYSDSSGSDLPNFDAGFGDPNKSKILGVVR